MVYQHTRHATSGSKMFSGSSIVVGGMARSRGRGRGRRGRRGRRRRRRMQTMRRGERRGREERLGILKGNRLS